jgi:hypothetical protein
MVKIKGLVVNDSIKAVKAHFGDQIYNSIVERLQGETRQLFERARIMPSD